MGSYVFCVGMARACSTWQYGVAGALAERFRSGQRLGVLVGEEFVAHDAANSPHSLGVLKTHKPDGYLAEALAAGRAVGVYSYRDLRDVAFSLMHKFAESFESIVDERRLIHQCLEHYEFWTAQPHMLRQRYEDLIVDPAKGVREIAQHMGLDLSDIEIRTIAAENTLESNRRRTTKVAEKLAREGLDLNDPRNAIKFDPKTLWHWNHLRDGRSGGWRTQATREQRAALARICGDWLIQHGYETDDRWVFEDPPMTQERAAS